MKVYKDIIQQTPEWFEVKKLKMSASHASAIISGGKGLNTYINNLIEEYFDDGSTERFSNPDMERGNLLEEQARTMYELEYGVEVQQVGFIESEDYVGVSPDGLVGEEGLIEIKNHKESVFIDLLLSEKIDKKYYDQIQMQLYVTGRKWCDYVGYNTKIKPNRFVQRIYPDTIVFEALEKGLDIGRQLIKKYIDIANLNESFEGTK